MAIPSLFTSPKVQVDQTKFGPGKWNQVTALLRGLLDGADADGTLATRDSTSPTGVAWSAAPVLGTSAARNVGTTPGTVAAGDHLHTGVYEPVIGTLAPAKGGTGLGAYGVGDLLYASGAAALAKLPDVAQGSVLVSGGVGAVPAWSANPPGLASYVPNTVGDGVADDTAAINAALAAAAGTVSAPATVKLRPGRVYLISAPLVVRSYTTFDISDCVIRMSGAGDNMITNRAFATSVRSVADGVTTALSNVVTSATANFSQADVGRSLVSSNGSAGILPVFTAVITGVTNATTATVDAVPSASTVAATFTLYDRDVNIAVLGSAATLIDRGAIGSPGTDTRLNSLEFRRVDGLRLARLSHASTANCKFAIHVGDVRHAVIEDHTLAVYSDGVHLLGPCNDVVIRRIVGRTGDDFVAIGCTDYAYMADVQGSITDVTIEDLHPNNAASAQGNGVHVYAGANDPAHHLERLRISGVYGTSKQFAVLVEQADTLSVVDHVFIDHVHMVSVQAGLAAAICTKGVIGHVSIRNVTDTGASGIGEYIRFEGTHKVVLIDNFVRTAASVASSIAINCSTGSVITHLVVVNSDIDMSGFGATSARPINLAATLTRLTIDNVRSVGSSAASFVLCANAQTVTITASNIFLSSYNGTYPWWMTGTVTLTLVNVDHGTCFEAVRMSTAATRVELHGSAIVWGNTAARAIDGVAGSLARCRSFAIQADLATCIALTAGDMAYNVNVAAAPFVVGPVICDGTRWRLVATGSVKTGTAVLVAGTVTVADALITANSVIRVASKTAGGTPGALFVSAKVAATSFTITSTNAADTSTVQYDIVSY